MIINLRKRQKKVVQPFDLWGDTKGAEEEEKSSKAKKIHPSSKRTKKNPIPHPGQSYNPDPEDHRRLLRKVVEKEFELKKREETIKNALKTTRVSSKDIQEHEKEQLVSGIEHLIKDTDNTKHDDTDVSSTDYSDYDEKDFEVILKDKEVRERRKTKKQRLGQLKDKLQRKAAKLKKLKNIRLSKIDAVKKITKELDKKEKEAAINQRKRHKKIKNERLGTKFEQSDPIYCLSSELPSNLRQASCPMDAIVREQLESFQSRLMVEPTSLQLKKRPKYKKKQYERLTVDEQGG